MLILKFVCITVNNLTFLPGFELVLFRISEQKAKRGKIGLLYDLDWQERCIFPGLWQKLIWNISFKTAMLEFFTLNINYLWFFQEQKYHNHITTHNPHTQTVRTEQFISFATDLERRHCLNRWVGLHFVLPVLAVEFVILRKSHIT